MWWPGTDIDALVGSPTIYEGTVYVGSFGGVLYAVDAATGQLKWSFKAEGGLWDGPAMVDGTLYFGTADGKVSAVSAASGEEKWRYDDVIGGPAYGSPILVELAGERQVVTVTQGSRPVVGLEATLTASMVLEGKDREMPLQPLPISSSLCFTVLCAVTRFASSLEIFTVVAMLERIEHARKVVSGCHQWPPRAPSRFARQFQRLHFFQ